jgi:conjugative relaxase-like TrwC/TraI family protein
MQIAKLRLQTGVQYLLNSIVEGDGTPPDGKLANYYSQKGNTPGTWLGSGLNGLGIEAGQTATKLEATLLFSAFLHPTTGLPLGQRAKPNDNTQVSGYDLTFRIPKSISYLWGVADRDLQTQIEACHDDAVALALQWLEDNIAHTRSGRDGVWSSPINGLNAIAYKHYESRKGDPHLHTHVAVSNRVQRTHDSKWLTLDGTSFYRSAVTVSEIHENILLDLLHERLGFQFHERDRVTTSTKSVVMDIAGIPTELIERFSQRRFQTKERYEELLAVWQADNPGQTPTRLDRNRMDARAWAETRAPKPKEVEGRRVLGERWRAQSAELGYHWADIIAQVKGHSQQTVNGEHLADQPQFVDQLARIVTAHWRQQNPG